MTCAQLRANYGNDGCDGFAPNFPLIRAMRNQAAKFYSILRYCTIKFRTCQWIKIKMEQKMKQFLKQVRQGGYSKNIIVPTS